MTVGSVILVWGERGRTSRDGSCWLKSFSLPSPHVSANWDPEVPLVQSHRWTQRPAHKPMLLCHKWLPEVKAQPNSPTCIFSVLFLHFYTGVATSDSPGKWMHLSLVCIWENLFERLSFTARFEQAVQGEKVCGIGSKSSNLCWAALWVSE